MATVHTSLPDALLREIKRRAVRNGHSLNDEILATIDDHLFGPRKGSMVERSEKVFRARSISAKQFHLK